MTSWRLASWTGLDETLLRRKTPGDGSCLIHSILYCISQTYRSFDSPGRSTMTRNIRDEMADLIPKYWDKVAVNKELRDIVDAAIKSGNEDDLDPDILAQYSMANVIKELRCDSYLNETLVVYLSILFNINIIVYSLQEEKQYFLGTELIVDYNKQSTVLVAYIGGHFETMGQKLDNENVLLIFSNQHPTIKHILKLAKKEIK